MKNYSEKMSMRKIPESPLMFVWNALYGARRWALCGVVLAFLLQLMKTFVPVFFSDMIDYFSVVTPESFSWPKIWHFLILVFLSYIAQSFFRMVRELVEENRVRLFLDAKIKLFCVHYLAGHSENYFASQKTGQLSQKVINCAEKTLEFHRYISRLYSNVFLVIINFYFIGCVSPYFLLLVIFFGSISAYCSYKVSFKVRELNKTADNLTDEFNGTVADSIGNALSVKAAGSETYEVSYIKRVFFKAKKARYAAIEKLQDSLRIQQMMLSCFEFCTLLYMVYMWYEQKISIGEATLVLILMNSVMSCFVGILQCVCQINSVYGALAAAMMPFVVEHEIKDVKNAKKLKISGGKIEFKNISFSYNKNRVFDKFSLKIGAGEKVGIVGISGSGKSTLINLLQRAYDISGGQILIDGQNIAKVTQKSLHDAIAVIPQDTGLFHRTIEQNIAYGNLSASHNKVVNAAKLAYADKFISGLSQGYQTKVGEKGIKLSGGERQRIAIARAILKNSPILILDEATSALDSEAENYIQKAMQNLMKGKTVVAIAHRLSTLKQMDKIIVLHNGKIAEQGTMDELLQKKGKFWNLWHLQNG